jgi:hypothetical protein
MTLLQEVQRLNAETRDHDRRERQAIEALHETRHQELRRDSRRIHWQQTTASAAISLVCAILAALAAIWATS